jgi:hypothetical protein
MVIGRSSQAITGGGVQHGARQKGQANGNEHQVEHRETSLFSAIARLA